MLGAANAYLNGFNGGIFGCGRQKLRGETLNHMLSANSVQNTRLVLVSVSICPPFDTKPKETRKNSVFDCFVKYQGPSPYNFTLERTCLTDEPARILVTFKKRGQDEYRHRRTFYTGSDTRDDPTGFEVVMMIRKSRRAPGHSRSARSNFLPLCLQPLVVQEE